MSSEGGETKTCRRCGRRLPRSEFYAYAGNRDGLNSRCKECVRAYYRRRYRTAASHGGSTITSGPSSEELAGIVGARERGRDLSAQAERDALIAALVEEYAAVPAQHGAWDRPWLCQDAARKSAYLGGARHALERVAESLGVSDLPERAASLHRHQEAP